MPEVEKRLRAQEGRTPWFLYEIYLKDGNILRFTNAERDVTFNGQNYIRFPISIPSLSANTEGKIDSIKLTVANADRMIQSYAEMYDGFRGSKVIIYIVFPDLVESPQYAIKEEYYVSTCEIDAEKVDFTLKPKVDFLDLKVPKRVFSKYRCQWRFKSAECGYTGDADFCDKTLERCRELENQQRFGGFPGVPSGRLVRL